MNRTVKHSITKGCYTVVKPTKCRENSTSKKSKKLEDFKISVQLSLTNSSRKMFTVRNVQNTMTIKNLRSNIELTIGIPYHLQRIHYIDDG